LQDIPVVQEKLASHRPPTDEAVEAGPPPELQYEMEVRYFLWFSVCILTIGYLS
jgi:hypothetical protein